MSTASAELAQSFYPAANKTFTNRTTIIGGGHFNGPKSERILLNPETTQDISEFYNIENELDFLDRYGPKLTQDEQFFYLVENQLKFLGEFVGQNKFTKIRYLLNERNGFNFAGVRMIDMLKHTTHLAGNESREGYENTGLVRLFKQFEEDLSEGKNELQRGLIISPPKDWNYGFAFYYEKVFDQNLGGFVMNMYPLRYAEERNQLANSKKLLSAVKKETNSYKNTEDYLRLPLTEDLPALERMLSLTNITTQDVRRSEEFQSIMVKELGAEIAHYSQGLMRLFQDRNYLSRDEFAEKYTILETLRRYIFNQAKALWQEKPRLLEPERQFPYSSQTIVDRFSLSSPMPAIDMRRVIQFGQQKPAQITGGGSCPVPTKSTSNSNLINELTKGNSIESVLANNSLNLSTSDNSSSENEYGYQCACGNWIPWEKNVDDPSTWLKACPHCKAPIKCE